MIKLTSGFVLRLLALSGELGILVFLVGMIFQSDDYVTVGTYVLLLAFVGFFVYATFDQWRDLIGL